MQYIPYVYLIKNKTTGLKYLGVRYARNCHPSDLWNTYFTSSKLVKKLIREFGETDFIVKIIHQFPNRPEDAVLKEASYFPMIKKRNDYLNITYSSGIQDLRICSKAGKVGGSIVKSKCVGIFRSDEERKEWASKGGKAGGKIQAELGLGFHVYHTNPKLHKEWASKGGKTSNMFQNKTFQIEMGKRGGAKNKGFIWYNDGTNSFKYTKKQQENKSFDDFLDENTQYTKGRIINAKNKENL